MADNIVRLPRPVMARPPQAALGFFVRVGRDDHKELLELIASGERGIFGFIVSAQNAGRHAALIAEARKRDFDVILDPKTQSMGLPGSYTDALGALPWGGPHHHKVSDFDGRAGQERVHKIIEFARNAGFTQLLGPTHVITGPNDPWLRRDVQAMNWARAEIARRGLAIDLIYSLAAPMEVMRLPAQRQAIKHAVADAALDALWLKIENFGDDATGDKTAAYIEACRDFHDLNVPLVADHVGGLPGLAALGFGAVGGICHGVTMNQGFSASAWRRPPPEKSGGGGTSWRVYLQNLDMLVKPAEASAFLGASPRVRGRHACPDPNCCRRGQPDMLQHPVRHALYQQAREVEWLGSTPATVRAARYVDEKVRRISDNVAAVAGLPGFSEPMQKAIAKKQKSISRFREVMSHLAAGEQPASVAVAPARRVTGGGRR